MKILCKRAAGLLAAVLVLAAMFAPLTFAASASVSLSRSSVSVGNTLSATITFSGDGTIIGAVDAYVSYNSQVLEFQSGDSSSGGGGSVHIVGVTSSTSATSLSYTLNFKAIAAGSCSISVTNSNVIGFETDTSIGSPTSGATVTVTNAVASTTPGTVSSSTATSPTEPESEISKAIEVSVDGSTLYLWRGLADVTLPNGFELSSVAYGSETVNCAKGTVRPLVLLYLTYQDGTNGRFYIYDESDGSLRAYVTATMTQRDFVFMDAADVVIPDGFTASELEMENVGTVTAYTDSAKEIWLVYVMNETGTCAFYRYDVDDKTFQLYSDAEPLIVEEDAEPAPTTFMGKVVAALQRIRADHGVFLIFIAVSAAAVVFFVLAIVLLVLFLRARRRAASSAAPFAAPTEDELTPAATFTDTDTTAAADTSSGIGTIFNITDLDAEDSAESSAPEKKGLFRHSSKKKEQK